LIAPRENAKNEDREQQRRATMEPVFSATGLVQRVLLWGPVVVSAGLAALAVRLAGESPATAIGLLVLSASAFLPALLARRRFRRMLQSGDPILISALWRTALEGTPHSQATEALMNALTFAACGWVDEARMHLGRASRGTVWDPAGEHRLIVETLLEAFDGDRSLAVRLAERFAALPLPAGGARVRREVVALRVSMGALARAFAHESISGDLEALERAARSSPLVSWAMRYAAAIVSVDHDQPERALAMLEGAPHWPPQSAFRAFHRELVLHIARSTPKASAHHGDVQP